MARNTTTSRETKARQLVESGAVTLHIGVDVATVKGSGGNVYRVTKDACDCSDFVNRGVDCKHRICVRWLCTEYRLL